jgi:DNA invertase Pin-like site-specific DNA recombinase
MTYGYARVSTKGQETAGNSLEAQIKLLKDNGAQEIYSDSLTGIKRSRPELDLLLTKLQEGDTLVVVKLDRLMRSLTEGIKLINNLIERGITLKSLGDSITFDNKPMNKAMRQIVLVFAELERELIIERTREGKAIAKQNPNFREGRPKLYSEKQINHALELLETKTYKEVEELTGISKSTITRARRVLNNA